ncbi:16558_t:CDS:1, partial [Cetraspora pellucida]
MTLYQDNSGSVWLSGLYQTGFNPKNSYSWSIVDSCNNSMYDLTSSLGIEWNKCDSCSSSSHSNSHYYRKGRRNVDEKCGGDDWGTMGWVVKINDLMWDCDGRGVSHQGDSSCKKDNKRALTGEGPGSGFFLQVGSSDGSGPVNTPINVNNEGNVVAPPPP